MTALAIEAPDAPRRPAVRYAAVPNPWADHPDATPHVQAVLRVLCRDAGSSYETTIPNDRIVELAKASLSSVIRALNWLERAGAIRREKDPEARSRRRIVLLWIRADGRRHHADDPSTIVRVPVTPMRVRQTPMRPTQTPMRAPLTPSGPSLPLSLKESEEKEERCVSCAPPQPPIAAAAPPPPAPPEDDTARDATVRSGGGPESDEDRARLVAEAKAKAARPGRDAGIWQRIAALAESGKLDEPARPAKAPAPCPASVYAPPADKRPSATARRRREKVAPDERFPLAKALELARALDRPGAGLADLKRLADHLAGRWRDAKPKTVEHFVKVGRTLGGPQIEALIKQADAEGDNPAKLFSTLTGDAMAELKRSRRAKLGGRDPSGRSAG